MKRRKVIKEIIYSQSTQQEKKSTRKEVVGCNVGCVCVWVQAVDSNRSRCVLCGAGRTFGTNEGRSQQPATNCRNEKQPRTVLVNCHFITLLSPKPWLFSSSCALNQFTYFWFPTLLKIRFAFRSIRFCSGRSHFAQTAKPLAYAVRCNA